MASVMLQMPPAYSGCFRMRPRHWNRVWSPPGIPFDSPVGSSWRELQSVGLLIGRSGTPFPGAKRLASNGRMRRCSILGGGFPWHGARLIGRSRVRLYLTFPAAVLNVTCTGLPGAPMRNSFIWPSRSLSRPAIGTLSIATRMYPSRTPCLSAELPGATPSLSTYTLSPCPARRRPTVASGSLPSTRIDVRSSRFTSTSYIEPSGRRNTA
mmetsp:Transcript_56213/g.133506  ORF Transcript_56213/g.133506 Transcript_56213/m.133506 type:complete len:210 (+) Transcript_56213:854-1483(+)